MSHAFRRLSKAALDTLGIAAALAHCRRQSSTAAQSQRHFHQWFDAFRTLKLMHALRDAGWPQLSLHQLDALQPAIWRNVTDTQNIASLRTEILWRD